MDESAPKPRKSRKQEIVQGQMTWQILERLLNHYNEWQEIYLTTGNPDLKLDNNLTVNIYDLMKGIDKLPPRQKQAVVLSCLENRREVDVAKIMGFQKWSSQVGMYKRKALKNLCDTVWKNYEC